MFTTIIVQPIFNLLVFITAIIPGHNFGLGIILFTIIVRLLMWPLVRKQLHHAKAMRQLQPELKKIKKAAGGDRQRESQLMMELYKEREINPFASIGILIVQIPILIGLYASIRKIIGDPHEIATFSYPFLHHLGWIQQVGQDIHRFDSSLFGLVNLTRTASGPSGIYWPAMVIVVASAIAQYLQSKQLMPSSKESRSLRAIMREAGEGKSADQGEVNAAVSRTTVIFIPVIVLLVSLHLAVALPLYWLVSSTMAYIQQAKVLEGDVTEEEAIAESPSVKKDKPSKKSRLLAPPKPKPAPAGVKVKRTSLKDYSQNKDSSSSSKRRNK